MPVRTNLGNLTTNPKGEWDINEGYSRLDQVFYNGSTYTAKADIAAGQSPSDSDLWVLTAVGAEPASQPEVDSGEINTKFLAPVTAKTTYPQRKEVFMLKQKRVNVTSSRALGTAFTNPYGAAIEVNVEASTTGAGTIHSIIDGDDSCAMGGTVVSNGHSSVNFRVPAGSTYMVNRTSGFTSPVVARWIEVIPVTE